MPSRIESACSIAPEVAARSAAPGRRAGRATMARKRRGQPVHGWIVLDKPLRHEFEPGGRRGAAAARRGQGRAWRHARSAGDRCVADRAGRGDQDRCLCHGRPKALSLHVRWGEARDTDDAEGAGHRRQRAAARRREPSWRVLPAFGGTIRQRPPAYSAIKVAGERAYDLARGGEIAGPGAAPGRDRPAWPGRRPMPITPSSRRVGKGTYIRSLGARFGPMALGTTPM